LEASDKEGKKNYEDLKVKSWISKPKFGREGHGVLFSSDYASMDAFVEETNF